MKEIIAHPRQFSIPDWFLNRQKDVKTGKFLQLTANQVDTKYREDLERMKKIRYVILNTLVCLLDTVWSTVLFGALCHVVHPRSPSRPS